MKKNYFILILFLLVFSLQKNYAQQTDTLWVDGLTPIVGPSIEADTVQYCAMPPGKNLLFKSSMSGQFENLTTGDTSANNVTEYLIPMSSTYDGAWFFRPTGHPFPTSAWYLFFDELLFKPFTDTSIDWCDSLLAQPIDKPGNTYQWSTGDNTYSIATNNIHTFPTQIWVTVSNTCETVVDSITITWPGTPLDLGGDSTYCSVTLDAGAGASNYLWSTGEITQSIFVNTTGTYWVRKTHNGCQLRDTSHIIIPQPVIEPICYVDYDTTTMKNAIHWNTNLSSFIDSIKIYKETSQNVWIPIGTMAQNHSMFIDMNSNPQNQSYSYKISAIDTCGNETPHPYSTAHTTITLLATYDEGTDTYGFSWSHYIGLLVPTYTLFGVTANNTVDSIGSVPGNQNYYNYTNPTTSYARFFVGFEAPACDGAKGVNNLVKSNFISTSTIGIDEKTAEQLTIYPNPAKDRIYIQTTENEIEIEIINAHGQVVIKDRNKKEIDISFLPSGTYIIRLTANSFSGQRSFIVY